MQYDAGFVKNIYSHSKTKNTESAKMWTGMLSILYGKPVSLL